MENWKSKDDIPEKTGLYTIRFRNGSFSQAFVSRTIKNKLVWVIPNELAHFEWLSPYEEQKEELSLINK